MKFIVGLFITIAIFGMVFISVAKSEVPGKDFPEGECVSAYNKFGTGKDILEKLNYKDAAKATYGKYTDSEMKINMSLLADKYNYLNYTAYRQYSRYISCRANTNQDLF